jgi:hypothetical protein
MPVPDRYCPIQKKNMMTWPAPLSNFFLNMVCEFIKNEVSMDKGFRMNDLKAIVEFFLKLCGCEVLLEPIYKHIRHWKARWVHVLKVKRLEGVGWVDETIAIMMYGNVYFRTSSLDQCISSFTKS